MHSQAMHGAHASNALQVLARAGYAARGFVYLLVGILVLWSCWHGGGTGAPDSRGALATLSDEPLGSVALWLVAAGLVGYAIWRTVQALRDPDDLGSDAKGLTIRTALAVSAVVHVLLAISAAQMAQGFDGSSGSEGWTAELMRQPWGRWLVGAIGVAVIGAGIAQAVKGWKGRFIRYFDTTAAGLGHWYQVCRFGLIARGAVFVIIGGLLVQAAVQYTSNETGGLRGAFNTILQQPHGVVLLAIVGAGLLAFSIYSFLEAKHRRVAMH